MCKCEEKPVYRRRVITNSIYVGGSKNSGIRLRPLTAFPLKILDNVSSIGSGDGIPASSRKGSTSKGTKVSNLYKYFK